MGSSCLERGNCMYIVPKYTRASRGLYGDRYVDIMGANAHHMRDSGG